MYTRVENSRFRYYSGKSADIQATRAQSQRVIAAESIRESNHNGDVRVCPVYDTRLVSPIRDDVDTYDYVFGAFAPPGQDLREYIEGYLGHKAGKVVAMDVGGPGSEAMNDFSNGFVEASFGLALTDKRPDVKKARDVVRGHDIIAGDITAANQEANPNAWAQLDEQLGGRQVDVTFIRMGHGNEALPQIPQEMMGLLNQCYKRTSDSGMIMLNVPPLMHPLIALWMEKVHEEYPEVLEVQLSQKAHGKYLEIKKHPGAPEEIPTLSHRKVRVSYDTAFQRGKYAKVGSSESLDTSQDERQPVATPSHGRSVIDELPNVRVLWRADTTWVQEYDESEPVLGASLAQSIGEQEQDWEDREKVYDISKDKSKGK